MDIPAERVIEELQRRVAADALTIATLQAQVSMQHEEIVQLRGGPADQA